MLHVGVDESATAEQDAPHAPQLVASLCRFTQTLLQLVSDPEQPQLLARQDIVEGHAWPQVPQLLVSLEISVHVFVQ